MNLKEGKCELKLRRSRVLDDSFAAVMRMSGNELKKRLVIKFEGEDGLDYGGVSRYGFHWLRRPCSDAAIGSGSSWCLTRSSTHPMACSNILHTTITPFR
jgi:E3 ubiquitin-protein ligase NEDD4